MKSQEVLIHNKHGRYGFAFYDILDQVACERFPDAKMQKEEPMDMLKWAGVDDWEDMFTLKHMSIDFSTGKATVFYEDNHDVWCFSHMQYQTEDAHEGKIHG